jgi:hypothetical protein
MLCESMFKGILDLRECILTRPRRAVEPMLTMF